MIQHDCVRLNDEGNGIYQLILSRPKGNIIDAEMVAALKHHILMTSEIADTRAFVISGEGPHFSFGASVEEHQPEGVAEMLRGLHDLMKTMIASNITFLAAVRGYCLGGGLEVASFCHRVFATSDSKCGQPEIELGVFAPVASVVLPLRCGQAAADDLLLSGRTVDGEEAHSMGLVDEIHEDPVARAVSWARDHLAKKSASSLRLAVAASRRHFNNSFLEAIDVQETCYLNDLMSTRDAVEGIAAYLEKRKPVWTNS